MWRPLRNLLYRLRMAQFGLAWNSPLVFIHRGCELSGRRGMTFGEHVILRRDCWLVVPPCAADPSLAGDFLSIGRGSDIGRSACISAASSVKIGERVLFGPRVFVSDNDHVYADTRRPVLEQGWTRGGGVTIGDNCWLGVGAIVLGARGITIGRNSVVGAGAVVIRDVPPYSVVVGSPARIVRQFDPQAQEWRSGFDM